MQFNESMFRQVAKYESKGKISSIRPSYAIHRSMKTDQRILLIMWRSIKDRCNKHDDTKDIGNSDNDSKCDLKRRNFHAYNCEVLAKTMCEKAQRTNLSFIWKLRLKINVCETLVWAAFETIEKIELAANNGDTLVEVVISAKRTNSD